MQLGRTRSAPGLCHHIQVATRLQHLRCKELLRQQLVIVYAQGRKQKRHALRVRLSGSQLRLPAGVGDEQRCAVVVLHLPSETQLEKGGV